MAINQNHLFEELNGVKCAIVEKNVTAERVEFLRSLLEFNKYTVVVVPSATPETFTIGVTDVMFNPVNAIFGRLLKTREGHVVTLAYWQQKEKDSNDEAPYFGTIC
ncbi:MAG: hypothetical protein J0H74_12255 [Chitinophagaceae bacterium]|nr:hypothetical protein [Chitinophagaceae bacterium]